MDKFMMVIPSALLRSRARAALADGAGVTFPWAQWGPYNTRIVNTSLSSAFAPGYMVLGWKACVWGNEWIDRTEPKHIVIIEVFDFNPLAIRKADHDGLHSEDASGYPQQHSGYLTDDPPQNSRNLLEYDSESMLRCRYGRFIADAFNTDDACSARVVLMADGLLLHVCPAKTPFFR